ncbi:MAG: MFS transporter [Chloroflexi bacterium]|nr:MFS transporter [Chloroflexota bacterium]
MISLRRWQQHPMLRFVLLWFGQTGSMIGSSLTGFALGIWVYQQHGVVSDYAWVLLTNTLPATLIAPWAGALSDRFNRRTVMLISDSIAGLSTIGLIILFSTGQLVIWQIYLANSINALARACQWPAYVASVPQLVDSTHHNRANGLMQLSHALAQLLAPLIGSSLLAWVGMPFIFTLDLLTFGLALVITASTRFAPQPQATEHADVALLQTALLAWREFLRYPSLVALTSLIILSNFSAGSIEVLITPLVLELHSVPTLGMLLTFGGLGMVAGSLLASMLRPPRGLARAVLLAELIGALAMLLAGWQPSVVGLAIAAIIYFGMLPWGSANHTSLIQQQLPNALHGRIFALISALASLALTLGFVSAGLLADRFFTPAMQPHGWLNPLFAWLVGTQPSNGIQLQFISLGLLTLLWTIGVAGWHARQTPPSEQL